MSQKGRAVFSVISVLLVSGSAVAPIIAHAGVISDMFAAFTTTAQAYTTDSAHPKNVQTMTLPAPATNIDPMAATGGGDITVVDDSALLSEEGPSGTVADIVEPQSGQISKYVVRPGDSISGIAKMYNVSVNTIMWSNNLSKGSSIKEGQVLTILPISGIPYTVRKGDTLPSIAKASSGDVNEIAQYNGLDSAAPLPVGTQLIIPNGEIATPVVVATVHVSTKSGTKLASNAVRLSNGRVIYEPAHNTNGPSYKGYYAAPLSHYIETQGLHGYNAVDLAASVGTPVTASAAGTVIVSRVGGWNGGYGTYVVISHDNGTQTLYAHMSKDDVAEGDQVAQGDVIGAVGMTGETTGPHLHFEVRGAQNPF